MTLPRPWKSEILHKIVVSLNMGVYTYLQQATHTKNIEEHSSYLVPFSWKCISYQIYLTFFRKRMKKW